jgi:adenosine 3'-phospho 5'-phosphosulfate transporter B2
MIMGSILNKQRYSRWEYAQAFVMGLAMTVLVYSSTEEKTPPTIIKLDPDSWEHFFRTMCTNSQYTIGAAFLLLYYVCDSFTSNWQAKLYKEHKISEHQMMFAGNFCAMIFMGVSAVFQPRPFLDTYNMIRSDVWILWRIVVLSVCAAFGQLWIYYTIKEFGPLVFTSIMTLRQIFSVLLSIFWFGHECTPLTGICMSAVFGVVIAQQIVKVYNYSCKHTRKKEA